MGEVLCILFFRSCSYCIQKRKKKKKRQTPMAQKGHKIIKRSDKLKRTSLRSLLIATSL